MQIYDIAIAPGMPRQIDAEGNYFYFYTGEASGADTSIKLQGRSSGLQITLLPGQSYKLQPDQMESSWILTNRLGGGTITGSVIIGKGAIDDNRITGTVEVIDGARNRVRAGQAFAGFVFVGGAASVNAHAQIWNPAGSGKNVIISQYQIASDANSAVSIGLNQVALSTLGSVLQSKFTGSGFTAAAQGRQQSAASGAVTILPIAGPYVQAATTSPLVKFSEPLVLRPGWGLVFINQTVNASLVAVADLFEEPI